MKFICIFGFLLGLVYSSFSQCCSTGSPVAGVSSVGIVEKNNLRITTIFRHGVSDTYFSGQKKSETPGLISSADFNYLSAVIGYGIIKRLSAEMEFGYFFNKTQHFSSLGYNLKGFGLNNAILSIKYNLFTSVPHNLEYTAGIGVKFPFSTTPQAVDNVQLPVDIQPSTHAYGVVFHSFLSKKFVPSKIKLILVNRYEMNGKSSDGYQFGSILFSSLFAAKQISDEFTGVLQIRNEWKVQDNKDGLKYVNTGSNIIYISPQISFRFHKVWNFSAMFDLPVYRYYNGTQFGSKYAYSFTAMRELVL